jgi:hypothetical protein
MAIIATESLFQLSLNRLLWVIVGLVVFSLAFIELYHLPPDAIGDAVLLVLTVLPLAVFAVSADEFSVAMTSKPRHVSEAIAFGVAGLISGGYFLLQYRSKEKRDLLDRNKVLKQPPGKTVSHVAILLVGSIAVLGCVALLVAGGWEFVQGSVTVGFILVGLALAIEFIERRPRSIWNPVWRGRKALKDKG